MLSAFITKNSDQTKIDEACMNVILTRQSIKSKSQWP